MCCCDLLVFPPAAQKFLQALKDFGDVDEEAISEAHLRTEYGTVRAQVGGHTHWLHSVCCWMMTCSPAGGGDGGETAGTDPEDLDSQC